MRGVLISIRAYLSSIGIIFKPRYFKYLIYSGLVSVVFFIVSIVALYFGGDYLTDLLTNLIKIDWLRSTLDVVTNIISVVGLGLLLLLIYKHIVLIIVGPIMGVFSEKLERERFGDEKVSVEPKFGAAYSTYRGVRIASRNIIKELFWTIVLLLLSVVIPFLSVVTVPLIFIVQAYYAGFGNMDISIGRHLDFKDSVDYVKRNRLMVTANGAIFLAILLIPVIGTFLAPMLATSASTLSMAKDRQLFET